MKWEVGALVDKVCNQNLNTLQTTWKHALRNG